MPRKQYVSWIDEVTKEDISSVGKKAAELGEMSRAKLPIPLGFIITTQAFTDFLKHNKLNEIIEQTLNLVNFENSHEIAQASSHIETLISKAEIPNSVVEQIVHYYDTLKEHEDTYYRKNHSLAHHALHRLHSLYKVPVVSIKPSISSIHAPHKTFNVHSERILGIHGETELILRVKDCWKGLYSQRALYYAHEHRFDFNKLTHAVIVQRIVSASKSGHVLSLDPLHNDKNKIIIESVKGTAKALNDAKVIPDRYVVDKKTHMVLKKEVTDEVLTANEILQISKIVKSAENLYYFPQDIEWSIEGSRIFIVDIKPLTNINTETKVEESESNSSVSTAPVLKGTPVAPGIVVGNIQVIHSPNQASAFKKGDILVVTEASALYLPTIKKASALICEKGGRTSYAAHIAIEQGIPSIVGVEHATSVLRNDQVISVNGKTGEIFKGNIRLSKELGNDSIPAATEGSVKTLSKVYVSISSVDDAHQSAKIDNDGVGLLKAESLFHVLEMHPQEYIKQGKQELFIKTFTHELEKIIELFPSKPIIYRTCDFTANEYRSLKGGALHETAEVNPLLGFRGAARYVEESEIFMLELQAVKRILERGYKNFQLMVPFVRVPWELMRVKEIVSNVGLNSFHGFKLWMIVEVPSTAILFKEFVDIGIDGVSIGMNDLTAMVLGVDKHNPRMAHLFDTQSPAVSSVMDFVIETCKEHDIPCIVTGDAVSDSPDFVERVVGRGATGVVARPDALNRTRAIVYAAEKKIHSAL